MNFRNFSAVPLVPIPPLATHTLVDLKGVPGLHGEALHARGRRGVRLDLIWNDHRLLAWPRYPPVRFRLHLDKMVGLLLVKLDKEIPVQDLVGRPVQTQRPPPQLLHELEDLVGQLHRARPVQGSLRDVLHIPRAQGLVHRSSVQHKGALHALYDASLHLVLGLVLQNVQERLEGPLAPVPDRLEDDDADVGHSPDTVNVLAGGVSLDQEQVLVHNSAIAARIPPVELHEEGAHTLHAGASDGHSL